MRKTNQTKTALPPRLSSKHSVLIVEDHPILREGLVQLLQQDPTLKVVGEADSAREAFASIQKYRPDIVLLDISLKDSSGFELLKNAKAVFPTLMVLVLSMHEEELYAERALRAGAAGYLMKQEASDLVLVGIRKVLAGEIFLSPKMSSKLMHQLVGGKTKFSGSMMDRLSDRELEIFGLIGEGRATREIAKHLNLSVKTIESHRAHIKEKLAIGSATELVHRAIQMRQE
jgi:DNA-binding NarL/FixJ family response regulator